MKHRGGSTKGKKGKRKADLFKSLEMQKKSHDLYTNYFSAASIQSLLKKKASPNWNNPEDNGNTVLILVGPLLCDFLPSNGSLC